MGASAGLHGSALDLKSSELLALGLACNITRVFSLMLTSPATTHIFSEVGVYSDMHTVCHSGAWQSVYNITQRQMECLGVFLDSLASHVDPTGASLLDRALVLATSEYGEGWQHSNRETPVLLAGRANGALNPGFHLREPEGNLSKVHVTLLRALGLHVDSYGFNGAEASDDFGELLA